MSVVDRIKNGGSWQISKGSTFGQVGVHKKDDPTLFWMGFDYVSHDVLEHMVEVYRRDYEPQQRAFDPYACLRAYQTQLKSAKATSQKSQKASKAHKALVLPVADASCDSALFAPLELNGLGSHPASASPSLDQCALPGYSCGPSPYPVESRADALKLLARAAAERSAPADCLLPDGTVAVHPIVLAQLVQACPVLESFASDILQHHRDACGPLRGLYTAVQQTLGSMVDGRNALVEGFNALQHGPSPSVLPRVRAVYGTTPNPTQGVNACASLVTVFAALEELRARLPGIPDPVVRGMLGVLCNTFVVLAQHVDQLAYDRESSKTAAGTPSSSTASTEGEPTTMSVARKRHALARLFYPPDRQLVYQPPFKHVPSVTFTAGQLDKKALLAPPPRPPSRAAAKMATRASSVGGTGAGAQPNAGPSGTPATFQSYPVASHKKRKVLG